MSRRWFSLSTVLLGVVFAVSMPAPPVAGATHGITVTPNSGLADGQSVSVVGTGFTPLATVGICESLVTPGPADTDLCGSNIFPAGVLADGSFQSPLTVRRFMYIPRLGTVVDCLDPSVQCIVAAAEAEDIQGTVATAPISFAAEPPLTPAITVTPNVELHGGTDVKVVGSGFGATAPVDLRECVATIPGLSGCGAHQPATTDASGAFTDTSFFITSPLLSTNCAVAPGTCEIRAYQTNPTVSAPLAFSQFQPDNWIVRLINGQKIGVGIFNLDGTGQQLTQTIAPGARPFFAISILNDGQITDSITVTGPGSSTLFTVRYFAGPYNVTAYVTGGGLTFTRMAPGAVVKMAVDIKADASAPAGATDNVLVTSTSVGNPTKQDAVKVGVIVAGAT